jgi:hypothetical protein
MLVAGLVALSSGCAMCCAPYDYDYPSVAGRYVRTNPSSGRVASVFDEAGGPSDVAPAASTSPFTPQAPAAPQLPGGSQAPPGLPPMNMTPGARSVIPRNMGESYLPR